MGIGRKLTCGLPLSIIPREGLWIKTLSRIRFPSRRRLILFQASIHSKHRHMEITGQIIQLLPEVTGTGRSGNSWRKQEFILETRGQYPRKVCMSLWGDKIDQFSLQSGAEITASVEVESREYNGRWYTDVRAWKIAAAQAGVGPAGSPSAMGSPNPSSSAGSSYPSSSMGSPLPAEPDYSVQGGDDMPF